MKDLEINNNSLIIKIINRRYIIKFNKYKNYIIKILNISYQRGILNNIFIQI